VNLKRIYRVYRAAGLAVRRRQKKLRAVARPVQPALQPTACNHWWAMDFLKDALASAYQHGVQLVFIDPGKPVQNAHVESFNGKVRDEFLNEHWFISIREAQVLAEAFRVDFNTVRPHSSLKYLTPEEFVRSLEQTDPPGGRRNDDRQADQGLASPAIDTSSGGERDHILTEVAGSQATLARPQDQKQPLTTAGIT
jgi:integrase-like protein